MAIENVAQSTAHDTTADPNAIFQMVMDCEPMICPETLEGLRKLAGSAELTGRPWRFAAYVASRGRDFFTEVSEDASTARLMAPMTMILEEFAERLRMVADLAAKSALRIRVAGCNHPDFDAWREEDPNADTDGGAAHV